MNKLISIKTVCEMLGVTPATLRTWDKNNELCSVRTKGGHRRYNLHEIEKLQSEKSRKPGPKRRPAPIGQKFNMLTIIKEIEPVKQKNRKCFIRRVIAKCDCGKEQSFRLQQIISGQYKSCGHLIKDAWQELHHTQKENAEERIKQSIGSQFFGWTILSGGVNEQHQSVVVAQCQCGSKKELRLDEILLGKTKSCGCSRINKLNTYISEVDGEEYKGNITSTGYVRIRRNLSNFSTGGQLHVVEAEKVFVLLNKKLDSSKFHVHHIDYNKSNASLCNLAILESGAHQKHHANMEKSMYSYLSENGLLGDFYEKNSHLKLTTVRDMMEEVKND